MKSAENLENIKFQAIWRKLNRNQRRFVVGMTEHGSKKSCAESMGLAPGTVYGWPAYVDEAVELYQEHIVDVATIVLADAIADAALVKVSGLESGDERVKQSASTEILDRHFGKPKQRTEHTGDDGGPLVVEFVSLGGIDPEKDI